MVRFLGCLLVVLLAVSAIPVAAQARHQDLFRAGLRAYDLGFWRESLLYFEAAAEAQPVPRGKVRQYGMWSVPYQPYYYQCLALIELGLYLEALQVLELPEAELAPREGEHLSRRRRRLVRQLTEEIRSRLRLDSLALSRSAEEDQAAIEALARRIPHDEALRRRLYSVDGPIETESLPDLAPIEELLEKSETLRQDSLLASAEQIAMARAILERSREVLERVHRWLVENELSRREDPLREQKQRALESLTLADELGPAGTCHVEAIRRLESLELEGWIHLALSADEVAYPRARLLHAYLDCGWLDLAGVLLDQERGEQTLPPEIQRELELAVGSAEDLAGRSSEEGGTSKNILESPAPEEDGTSENPQRPEPSSEEGGTSGSGSPGAFIDLVSAADFLELVVTSRLGWCQGRALDHRLEELSQRLAKVELSTLQDLGIEDLPRLVGARDAWICEDPERLEEHLAALGAAKARPPEIQELTRWLSRQPRMEARGYALLVAASDYSSALGWRALRSPKDDIREVGRALAAHGFEVETLEDPTFETLRETLDSFFFRHGHRPENRLVFYYAGHGHTEETRHGVKLGFLVPVDAGHPRDGREHLRRLFGMERFREYAIRSDATDMLFMFDSCFAGTVFQATRSCLPPSCRPAGSELGLAELIARPVRMFLTAGNETQKVPDQSLFRPMVTRALEGEADLDHDRWILGRELGTFVRSEVTKAQHRLRNRFRTADLGPPPAIPQWGTLTEAEFGQGDLVFRAPSGRSASNARGPTPEETRELALELRYWRAARRSGGEGLDRLLGRFPGGAFSALARSWARSLQ